MKNLLNSILSVVMINNVNNIYVDCDGVLLDGSLDSWFKSRCEEVGFEVGVKEYEDKYVDDLVINMDIINVLIELKERGYKIILWTNRGETEREMSKKNLGVYWELFDEVMLCEGKKGKMSVDGIVIDNEEKYLKCGVCGVLISTFKVSNEIKISKREEGMKSLKCMIEDIVNSRISMKEERISCVEIESGCKCEDTDEECWCDEFRAEEIEALRESINQLCAVLDFIKKYRDGDMELLRLMKILESTEVPAIMSVRDLEDLVYVDVLCSVEPTYKAPKLQ